MRSLILAVALGVAFVPAAQAASFDCTKARRADERAICNNRELNDLDVQMATWLEVTTSLVAMGQRGSIRDDQRDWLADRGRCGARVGCLRQSYRNRIAELRSVFAAIRSRGPF